MCVVGKSFSLLLGHLLSLLLSSLHLQSQLPAALAAALQEAAVTAASNALTAVYPWARVHFVYVTGIFQLTRYRMGNILPLGTSVVRVGWCRHHPRPVSAGEIQRRWTSHSTAPPVSCTGSGLGAGAAHTELEAGRFRQTMRHRSPPCLLVPRAGSTSPAGKNILLKPYPTLCCIYRIILPCFL